MSQKLTYCLHHLRLYNITKCPHRAKSYYPQDCHKNRDFSFFFFHKDLLGSFGSLVYLDVVVHGCVYLETACLQWWLGKLFIYPSNNREKVCNYGRITLLFAWFVFRLPGSQLPNHSVLLPTSLWYFQLIISIGVWFLSLSFLLVLTNVLNGYLETADQSGGNLSVLHC